MPTIVVPNMVHPPKNVPRSAHVGTHNCPTPSKQHNTINHTWGHFINAV